MSQIEKKKKWVFREPAFPDITGFEKNRIVSEIAANFNIPTILASMLFDRGCGSVPEAAFCNLRSVFLHKSLTLFKNRDIILLLIFGKGSPDNG